MTKQDTASAYSQVWQAPAGSTSPEALFSAALDFYHVTLQRLARFYSQSSPNFSGRRFFTTDEAIQAGRIAIWNAIRSWQPTRGCALGAWISLSLKNRIRCPHRCDTSYRYTPPKRRCKNQPSFVTFEDVEAASLSTEADRLSRHDLDIVARNLSLPAQQSLETLPAVWRDRTPSFSAYYLNQACALSGASAAKAVVSELTDFVQHHQMNA